MFRDKGFSLAFLISLSWHLFCMFCITIVVLPTGFPMAKVSNVSFLGPLLEKTAFEMMLDQKQESKRTLYKQPMYFDNSFLVHGKKETDKLSAVKFEGMFLKGKKEEFDTGPEDLLGNFKFTPPLRPPSLKNEAAKNTIQENFFIEGPLAQREILFKPGMPVISERIGQGQESFIIKLNIKVYADGNVDEIALLASSGYPDVDLAAINYVKAFRFSPLSPDAQNKTERSVIKVSFKSK